MRALTPCVSPVVAQDIEKKGCPYSIKANLSTSVLEQEGTFGEEEVDMIPSNNFQEARTSNVNTKDEYCPWVLVKRKRVGPKGSALCNPSEKN